MIRFTASVLRLATLALFTTASSLASAQALVDQSKVLAGNVTPGDAAGFPLTLSQPGHYRLTSNLYVPAGTPGIVVEAPGVTLDFNGFNLVGPGSCSRNATTRVVTCTQVHEGNDGVYASAKSEGFRVMNGRVQGFAGMGIYAQGSTIASRMVVSDNAAYGFSFTSGHILESLAERNKSSGFHTLGSSIVQNSRAINNGYFGINGSVVLESVASGNAGPGLYGRLRGSSADYNGGPNISGGSLSMGGNLSGNTPF